MGIIDYRTTIVFKLKDKIGALCDALLPFKKNNISLTRIISRPHSLKEWEYTFFVEIKGNQKDLKVKKALKELKKYTNYIHIYNNSYPLTML